MQKAFIKQLQRAVTNTGNLLDRGTGTVTLALSISDHRHRADVRFIRATSFKRAWDQVEACLAATPQESWVRIESVQGLQKLPRAEFERQLAQTIRMNYWRLGVSFDTELKTGLLEMEINGQAFFRPSKAHVIGRNRAGMWVDYARLMPYLKQRNGGVSIDVERTPYVWTFTTAGIFTDGNSVYQLETKENCSKGIRVLTDPKAEIASAIDHGETFLIDQLKADGKFIYGYYPPRQRVLSKYNTVRHFSSLYALLEAIQFTGRTADYAKVKLAIEWGLQNATIERDGQLFINDNGELKLGGQALLMLTLSKYQSVTGDESFMPVLKKVFKGVPAFIQSDGKLVHVLNPDLSLKSAYRIIYYEGEVVFGLTRLYELTKDPAVLAQIKQILDYMVQHDYGKYHDHWISYAINEALHVFPDNREYMALGLKNAFDHLKFMEDRQTTYPTLLELLDAAVKMTDLVRASGNEDLLAPYNLVRLRQAWQYRAAYEITSGSYLPEIAMYLYHPAKFIGGSTRGMIISGRASTIVNTSYRG
ncbi:glycosyl transferase family 1 [Lactiplantibacillus carotarum]|uniref:glycosyl transferase family 1 n=1 Tax=Lactiplantibacillus carotarum TaxID=2993456 RepID=UPI00298F2CE5|nr:glycosyl transferase family 1 [Lactiplantibacillus carotarum]